MIGVIDICGFLGLGVSGFLGLEVCWFRALCVTKFYVLGVCGVDKDLEF